jgi:STE24 endopeptidase
LNRIAFAIVVAFALLMLSTALPPSEDMVREAEKALFTSDEIALGLQRSWQSRLLMWGSQATHLLLLLVFVFTSLGRRTADRIDRLTGGRWIWTVLLTGLVFFLADALTSLPWQVARWQWNRSWGLSNQTLLPWIRDYAVGQGVVGVVEGIVLVGWFALIRWMPRAWWLAGAGLATLFGVVSAFLLPIVVAPLFNTFTPLRDTEWATLEPGIRKLVDDAGVPVGDILVADASRQSNHSNAYFTGFGSSRRIVLYDTLLKDHPADEIESILAHELGHWMHDHIAKGLLLGGLASAVGLYVLRRILLRCLHRGRLDLRAQHDPAALFLFVLLAWIGSWIAMPIQNAVSRHFERQADWTSLELAHDPEAFIRAERRLAVSNKGNLVPNRWNVWLFATHPPAIERIRMAQMWRSAK